MILPRATYPGALWLKPPTYWVAVVNHYTDYIPIKTTRLPTNNAQHTC